MTALLSMLGIGRVQLIAGLIAAGLSLAALGAGFVWGNAHATRAAMTIANQAADARVAALDKSYRNLITGYSAKLKEAGAASERLAEELKAERAHAASAATVAKEKLAHVTDASLDRPVPAAVLDLLREQPARR